LDAGRSNAARLLLLCSHKVTKGLVSREASFAALGHAAQSVENHGLQFMFPKAALGLFLNKIAMPLPLHRPPLFSSLLAEAAC
jgi:hypothetical protein